MIMAFWCVMLAGIMPIIWTFVAKLGPGSNFNEYDNNAPRKYLANVTGMAERANWAQQNSWEAFAPFAIAVIIAYLVFLDVHLINCLAAVFVFFRLVYGVAYIYDRPLLRSIAWVLAFLSNILLYILSGILVS